MQIDSIIQVFMGEDFIDVHSLSCGGSVYHSPPLLASSQYYS